MLDYGKALLTAAVLRRENKESATGETRAGNERRLTCSSVSRTGKKNYGDEFAFLEEDLFVRTKRIAKNS
jgi:hypothetical protein